MFRCKITTSCTSSHQKWTMSSLWIATIVVVVMMCLQNAAYVKQVTFMVDKSGGHSFRAPQPQQEHDRWISYETFASNAHSTTSMPQSAVPKGIPKEEDWLVDAISDNNLQQDFIHATRRIPRKLFKVNILDHGHLQGIFERNTSMLNGSIPDDRAIHNLQQAHMSWRQLNPGYDIRYFDLHACRQYLKLHFHPIFLRAFDCLEAYAAKTDLFRYLVVYREGGWYSDWKELCLKENLLDTLSKGNVTWFSTKDPYSQDLQMTCHQNAFFGATPRHVVLRNAITRVLQNIQTKYYGRQELQTTSVCVLGPAVEEEGYSVDGVNSSRVGKYQWAFNLARNVFKYNGAKIVQHKCTECGEHSDYANGNNYHKKYSEHEYYCPDAGTLFEP